MSVKHSVKVSRANKNLSPEENEAVFLLLGIGCQSQCTTIAQLFETKNNRWIKSHSGVLCLIKDNIKRSYFCRMYCLIIHEKVWEQEIYNELVIEKVRPFLLEFEGDVSDSHTGYVKMINLILSIFRKERLHLTLASKMKHQNS